MTLYGFADRGSLELFELLLSSSGVGPKLALAALGTHRPEVLRAAIAGGDLATLTTVPGIGKKVAERLVLELKDKVGGGFEVTPTDAVGRAPGERRSRPGAARRAPRAWATPAARSRRPLAALHAAGATGDTAELLRLALRELSGHASDGAPAMSVADAGDPDDVLDVAALPGEDGVEASLRPARLGEFVGQERVRRQLELVLAGARKRGQAADHVLLSGAPGLGKTTLAAIVAAEVGAQFRATSGPAVERPGDLAAILTGLEPGDVLFVDEIHRLPRAVEEVLYPAMEDFQLDIVVGKGPGRAVDPTGPARLHPGGRHHPHGPDRRAAAGPLRVRRPARALRGDELLRIVHRSARLLEIAIDDAGAREIARRSRGTPRIANRLLRRVRDYAEVEGDGTVGLAVARAALEVFDVDELGLDRLDRRVLEALVDRFGGGPGRPGDPGDLRGGGVGHRRGRGRALPAPVAACCSARLEAGWPPRARTSTSTARCPPAACRAATRPRSSTAAEPFVRGVSGAARPDP
jgi:holliday junction DNA helicase RuvB